MPIGHRNPDQLISFTLFFRHFNGPLFFEETTMETRLYTVFFFVIPAIAPFIEYVKIQVVNFHLYL